MYGQYQPNPTPASAGDSAQVRITEDRELIVVNGGSAPVGGGITWGAPTAVTLTGASQTLIAANANRKGLMIINRNGNATVSYDLAGGTVTLAGGIQMATGFQRDWYTGSDCPVGAVTIIGSAAQLVTYVEGT